MRPTGIGARALHCCMRPPPFRLQAGQPPLPLDAHGHSWEAPGSVSASRLCCCRTPRLPRCPGRRPDDVLLLGKMLQPLAAQGMEIPMHVPTASSSPSSHATYRLTSQPSQSNRHPGKVMTPRRACPLERDSLSARTLPRIRFRHPGRSLHASRSPTLLWSLSTAR